MTCINYEFMHVIMGNHELFAVFKTYFLYFICESDKMLILSKSCTLLYSILSRLELDIILHPSETLK